MRRAGYAAIVLILGLTACTSDGGSSPSSAGSTAPPTTPIATTNTATSATPEPSVATTGPNVRPGEKPPVLPEVARTNTRPGAAVFADFWFKALDWGYATTESMLVASVSEETCATCAEFAHRIDEVRMKSQHFVGGRIAITKHVVIADDRTHPGATVVDVFFNSEAAKVVTSTGAVVDRGEALTNLRWRSWLTWTVSGWRALDVKRVFVR